MAAKQQPKHPDAARVKAAVDPAAFYQHENPSMPKPRRDGWTDGGLCPFHPDTHKGNFRIHTETGAFTCFSCGQKGADVIAFLMQRDALTFPQALEALARDWGIRP